jgi:hypothetical protein
VRHLPQDLWMMNNAFTAALALKSICQLNVIAAHTYGYGRSEPAAAILQVA